MIPLEHILLLSAVLFCIGLTIIISKKNAIMVLMGVELLLNAANINLIAFSGGDKGLNGQMFSLFVIVVAAAEVAVALAIVMQAYKYFRHSDVTDMDHLN
ncbi:NADH-quinone oxidoreductase subunit K [Fulvitalea axinellae]|uniref:NADH-quinone oxidoreductase subunit K n=1 Tax=Fulvitalea axinellae TaxID=1182444 RepID=A0AAU9CMY0_9BACT|nr:NADH-quinone oxidoreductase subunit K [Fulvitalea axinellae]